MKKSSTSIYTVAAESGFSTATVSRALNGDSAISPETTEIIRKTAERIGYKKSMAASLLAQGKTGTITLLMPSIHNPVYASLGYEITLSAKKYGYDVSIVYSDISAEREKKIIKSLHSYYTDGFIIASDFWNMNKREIKSLNMVSGKPVVIRSFSKLKYPFDSVGMDNEPAAYEAAKYLINSGHRDIVYVGGGKNSRFEGLKKALRDFLGVKKCNDMLIQSASSPEAAYRSTLEKLPEMKATALFVQCDYLAIGVLRALGELGLKVPDDISIISFDDIEFARYGLVPLTTIRQDIKGQAEQLVKFLDARIKGFKGTVTRREFPGELVKRKSVKTI